MDDLREVGGSPCCILYEFEREDMSFIDSFVTDLARVRLASVFNPYADRCSEYDLPDSVGIRRANLIASMRAVERLDLTTIWLGRDLGYRGGRRTGLALTDEPHLSQFRLIYSNTRVRRATIGPDVSERTATEIWDQIVKLSAPPFLWNVFPFHPHEAKTPFTNRAHTAHERDIGLEVLRSLLDWLKPEKIVALGGDAHRAIQRLGCDCAYVRHPSYGGKADFIRGICGLYELARENRDTALDPEPLLFLP
jgi:hypothetical protein